MCFSPLTSQSPPSRWCVHLLRMADAAALVSVPDPPTPPCWPRLKSIGQFSSRPSKSQPAPYHPARRRHRGGSGKTAGFQPLRRSLNHGPFLLLALDRIWPELRSGRAARAPPGSLLPLRSKQTKRVARRDPPCRPGRPHREPRASSKYSGSPSKGAPRRRWVECGNLMGPVGHESPNLHQISLRAASRSGSAC